MDTFALPSSNYTITKALCWGYCYEHAAMVYQGNLLGRIVHAIIAFIEAIPLLSQIASLFEMLIVRGCSKISVAKRPETPLPPELKKVIENSSKFSEYRLKIEGQNNIIVTGMDIRPSNLFFEALGIKTTMPGSGKLFSIDASQEDIFDLLSDGNAVCSFSASGKSGEAINNSGNRIVFPDLTQVYGKNEYKISHKELKETLDSQEIFLSRDLPLPFYIGLKEALKEPILPGNDYNPLLLKELENDNNYPDLRNFLKAVRQDPTAYGFTKDSFEAFSQRSIYQVGSLVVKREDYRIFMDGNGKILARNPGEKDAIRLINACGIRGFHSKKNIPADVEKNVKQTFETALIAAESGIVLFPAVGMGVWGGDPSVYWKGCLDAIIESDKSFDNILVNPGHRGTPYGKFQGKTGNEFTEILNEYKTHYKSDLEKLAKLEKIVDLYEKKTDLVQLARNLKLAYPDKIVSLFNASDPDVTLGHHVGEYVNNRPHTSTTEENYTAIGTNGLCFERITGIHKEKDLPRIHQFK